MKSKLLLVVITVFFAGSAYCQIPEVMLGDTGVIAIFTQPYSQQDDACNSADFSLVRHLNNNFFYTTVWYWTGNSQINWGKSDTANAFFTPRTSGIQTDSTIFWSWWHCTPPGHMFDFADSVRYKFIAKGIDSIVVIKIKDSTIILPIDTQARKYKSTIDPFYFYSNIADSVLFDSWQLVINPSAKISFKVDSNINPLSEYLSKPFTRKKQLNFTFTSALMATDITESFPATMKTRVRYKGIDSIYSNTFTIILPAAPKDGVQIEAISDISFTINPNPFSKLTTLKVTTTNSEPVTLEIYDIHGNRKAIIANSEYINGLRDFYFDATGFAAGSYFARLVCEGRVITKKMIID